MTPRERLQLALELQEPDRIPIDLGGGVSSMTDCAYDQFKEYLQLRDTPGNDIQPYPEEMGGMCTVARFDELIDAGVDVLNPVQPLAKGMDDPEALNKRFGKRIVFHGGIDIQKVLPQGTTEEVYTEMRKRISGLAPGGGYILGAAHNIQVDVPPQNIVAMFEAAHKFGTYPIA